MTEPGRPLEALIASWRAKADKAWHVGHDDVEDGVWSYQHEANGRASAIRQCADELAALLQSAAPPAPQPASVPPQTQMSDAAEMLWVVLANVSGGDWTKQSADWREAAARWRDNYFAAVKAASIPQGDALCIHGTALDVHCCNCHSGFIFDKDHECPDAPPAPTAERKWIASGMTSYTADGEVTGYVNPPAAPPERVSEGKKP